jgi:hypothetical protein
MLKKARLLTRPTLARRDAPYPMQGRSSSADPRFTFHASRFTLPLSEARTKLADFFSILLNQLISKGEVWLKPLMSMPTNFNSTLGHLGARLIFKSLEQIQWLQVLLRRLNVLPLFG